MRCLESINYIYVAPKKIVLDHNRFPQIRKE